MGVGGATDCGCASASVSCRSPSGCACCCNCNDNREHEKSTPLETGSPAGGALTACEGSATWSATWSDSCSCCSCRASRPSSTWKTQEREQQAAVHASAGGGVPGPYPLCGLLLIWVRLSGSFLTALAVGALGDFSSTLTTLGEQGLEAGEKPPTASAGVPSGLKPLAFSLASARNTFLRSTSFSSCS